MKAMLFTQVELINLQDDPRDGMQSMANAKYIYRLGEKTKEGIKR